ncbi:MAG: hypothetical protein KDA61_22350 [Planctomycetales bacterium]|nr:hypothetical protein [Planctomycetales bacterium]
MHADDPSSCHGAALRAFALVAFCACALSPQLGLGSEVDVYVITGQSNALGTTSGEPPKSNGPGEHPGDASALFFWANVDSQNASYPAILYGESGQLQPLQVQQGDGGNNPVFWGPEFGLARALHEAGRNDVLIVKAARGGGGNGYWDRTTFDNNPNAGHMWGTVRDAIQDALSNLVAQGRTFHVKGLVYLQGESNSLTEAALVDVRLGNFVANVKQLVDQTYPGAADGMHTVVGEIAASSSNSDRIRTSQLQAAYADATPDATYVSTNDLPLKADGIHFGRDAKLTIGRRFASVLVPLAAQPNGILGDVNQDGIVAGDGTGPTAIDDVSAFLAGWRSDSSALTNLDRTLAGDLNLDGRTNLADAFLLHVALEQAKQGGLDWKLLTNIVPEPHALWLAITSAATLMRRTSRQQR